MCHNNSILWVFLHSSGTELSKRQHTTFIAIIITGCAFISNEICVKYKTSVTNVTMDQVLFDG